MNAALIPLVNLVTPNLEEASKLELKDAAAASLGGGRGAEVQCVDHIDRTRGTIDLSSVRIETSNNRGTGCALSSGIAAYTARGEGLISACQKAKSRAAGTRSRVVKIQWPGSALYNVETFGAPHSLLSKT